MPTPKKSLLPGYKRLPGGAERVQTPSGESISDRAYKLIARKANPLTPLLPNGAKIVSNEALAKFNKQTAPKEAAARPARGRKSLRKADEALREELTNLRLQKAAAEAKAKAEEKAASEILRKINRAKIKKQKVRTVSAMGFKVDKRTGKRRNAAQYDFWTEEELQDLYDQANGRFGIRYWGVGIRGVDERTGFHLDAWLAGLFDFSYDPSDVDLDDLFEEFQERKPYFVFTSFFVHFAK